MSNADIVPSDRETAFSSHESDEEHLWDAIEILKEKKGHYLVKWAGSGPDGKPWPDSWARKRDCTNDMVSAWKLKKAKEQRDKQRRADKKLKKARTSTVSKASEGSRASTSRQETSVAPSSRSLRSKTAVPAEPQYDLEQEYDSISRTPGNRRKRRLSTPFDHAPQDDPPSSRQSKKPRLEAGGVRRAKEEQDFRLPSPKKRKVVQSDDDEPTTIARPKGKGKEVDRSAQSSASGRSRSFLERNRHRLLGESGDETPVNKTAKSPVTKLPIATLGPSTQALSPRAQERLHLHDIDIAAIQDPARQKTPHTPDQTKQPLFLRGGSEDSDVVPPSHSAFPASDDAPAPRPHPQSQRTGSPVVSDYALPSPPPQTRHIARRHSVDDSYRVGDVPETQSTPETQVTPDRQSRESTPDRQQSSPKQSPVVSPTKKTLVSKMKPRSKPSTVTSPLALPSRAKSAGVKEAAPIRMVTGGQFKAWLPENHATGEEAEVEDLMSSIEQFSSPEKGSRRLGKGKGKGKGKRRQWGVQEDDEESEAAEHERMKARGVAMAEAARAERRAQMAGYERPQLTLNQILKGRRTQEGEETSMSTTQSDIPILPTDNGMRHSEYNFEDLRQEEEENTQDIMAEYNAAQYDRGHSDGEDGERVVTGKRSDAEESVEGVAEDSPRRNGKGNAAGDHSEAADGGYRSEADKSVESVRDRSEDLETDVDKYLDVDGPERSAWNEEHASQVLKQAPGEFYPEDLQDDSMEGLAYPDEDEPIPQVPQEPQEPPAPVTNGHVTHLSKSRSTSARSRKPVEDAGLELPPTASTRQDTPEALSLPSEAPADPRRLDAVMSLLNEKSEENHRLEALLADEQAMLAAERAKNVVLQERVNTLEQQSFSSTSDSHLVNRLKAVEELLAAERASLATALQSKAAVESERDAARRDLASAEQQRELFREYYGKASQFAEEKTAENKELEQRARIAEETTREGLATMKATFDLREVTLKLETRDWRNQANFLREQAIRTNDPDLRRRAAEHPELVAKYARLVEDNESLEDRLGVCEEDLRIAQNDSSLLEERAKKAEEERDGLKAGDLRVDGDFQVFRCGWRAEASNVPCPALCRTQEDLELHASMHVTKTLVDPLLNFGM